MEKSRKSSFAVKPGRVDDRPRAKPADGHLRVKLAEGGVRLGKEVAANF